jgi:malonyl-CoA/methylmalonyl-CoA synthetase
VTLTDAWVAQWRARPDAAVLVAADTGRTLTGAEVEAQTAHRAHALAAAGVYPGDRVLLSCAPSLDTVLAYVAILRLGAVVVPANTAYTAPELEHIVDTVAPTAAVIDAPGRLPGELDAGSWTAADLPVLGGTPTRLDAAPADAPAMIAFTSGTTGRPKGAVLSRGNLLAGARALVTAWGWTEDDRLLHALPMFHMHGLGAGLNGSFTAGASVAVLPRFGAEAVGAAVRDVAPTMFFGVPTMYALLRDAGALGSLRGLRLLVSGSAPLDPVLARDVAAATGQVPLERYGMSETVMLTSNPLDGERRPGSVGLPLPGVDVRLGADGGVEVSGPNVFSGYWERPDATAAAFTDDGWFRTGDVGELDPDGYLRLVGRASELIISGGYNVYPREVEDAILTHPDVVDAAVIGVPDDTWGERVVAFVVLRAGSAYDGSALDAALGAHVAERLAPYKHPRSWTVLEAIPRNAMGKILRSALPQG